MGAPTGTAAAVADWHDAWQPSLARVGARTFLVRPAGDGPDEAALLTVSRSGRAARLLVRDGDRVETSVDGAGAPPGDGPYGTTQDVLLHLGELVAWVLDGADEPSGT